MRLKNASGHNARRAGRILTLAALLAPTAAAQTLSALSNVNLRGNYFFRHMEFTTDTSGNVIDSRAALGTIQFDGAGHYALSGFQTVTSLSAAALALNGVYNLTASGTMTLTNPQRTAFLMNGRAGSEAILASTTESGDNTFDLFAAIPAPSAAQSNSSFAGNYYFSSFELPGGGGSAVRSALSSVTSGGNGAFQCTVTGHAANVSNGAISTATVNGLSYAIAAGGSGTISFGGVNNNLNGTKNLYISQSGNVILGGSLTAGAQDFLIGVKAFSGTPAASSISGLYWQGGLRLDLAHESTQAYAGSLNGLANVARVVFTDRLHQIGIAPGYDFTAENDVTVNAAGSFPNGTLGLEFDLVGLGAAAGSFVTTGLSSYDLTGYSIDVAVQAPALTGTGVYIHPQGIVNAAGLSPTGEAVSPGAFVSLFGSGLAGASMTAAPPYPLSLGGVTVTVNGTLAPLSFTEATQLNILMPYSLTGDAATIIVTNNGVTSNTVTVPLQTTSPAAFSADGTGTGDGAITHSNGTLVTSAKPAARGETVTIYAAGLGAVTPQPADGMPGTANPISTVNAGLAVTIGGQAAKVTFAGLSPGFPGLYQINVTIPSSLSGSGSLPLAIETADTFTDQVNIQVR